MELLIPGIIGEWLQNKIDVSLQYMSFLGLQFPSHIEPSALRLQFLEQKDSQITELKTNFC